MSDSEGMAQEGRQYRFRDDRGQEWIESWHSPELPAPDGKPHGSAGICFTPEGRVVLVTQPGNPCDFPAGRPEGDEDWRATLDREMLEEACAAVEDATLLGYYRGACIAGEEAGLVLVRSFWCADVSLGPWEPRHETTGRVAVPPDEALGKVKRAGSLYRRWFHDALVSKGLA